MHPPAADDGRFGVDEGCALRIGLNGTPTPRTGRPLAPPGQRQAGGLATGELAGARRAPSRTQRMSVAV